LGALFQIIERRALTNADLLIAAADSLRQVFAKRYAIPCITVENGFDPEEFDHLDPKKIYPDDGKLRFIYTGAVYQGRDPSPLFIAIRELIKLGKLTRDEIELVFYGRRMDGIAELAKKYSITEIVRIGGLVDRATALRAQRDASGLIFLEVEEAFEDGSMSSKTFEYFRAGRPILGIGMTKDSFGGRLMVEAGVGFPLGTNVEKIKEFLLTNYILNKAPDANPNWPFINKFSRKLLAENALAYLENAVNNYRTIYLS